MKILLAALVIAGGCTWTPRVIAYPDGSRIIQVDQFTLNQICSKTSDSGLPGRRPIGCYDRANRTTYVLYNCEGAQALTHERAHEQGISDPSRDGYDW